MLITKYDLRQLTILFDFIIKVDVKDENGVVTGKEAKIQFKQSFGFGLNLKW